MSDPRDSNHDGKVSFMEKIKHKLHKGHKDKDADHTTFHTSTTPPQHSDCPACLEAVGFPPAQAQAYANANGYPLQGQTHLGLQGQSFPEQMQGQVPGQFISYPINAQPGIAPAVALATVPLAGAVPLTGTAPTVSYGTIPSSVHVVNSNGHVHNSHDLNHDGRISAGEKLAGMASSHVSHNGIYDSRDTNRDGHVSLEENLSNRSHMHSAVGTGVYDSRDLNRDGHVSAGEKLAGIGSHQVSGAYDSRDLNRSSLSGHTFGGHGSQFSSGVHDARDLNHDGHVSMGEALAAQSGAAYDARDLNRDGHISMGEKLVASSVSADLGVNETRLKLHEEQLAVSKRQVTAAVVGLTKRVQEERVQHRVPVKREELIVERRPLTGIAGEHSGLTPSPDEISRVTIYREDIVTHTRLVPTEEVIVRKKIVTEHQAVGATLRSERVETTQTAPAHLAAGVGAYDARDVNLDGHVSAGERLHAAVGGASAVAGVHDARDINHDGHVSVSEQLRAAAGSTAQAGTTGEEMRLRLHEEQLAVSKREVQAAEVSIHKRIQEERVEQMVPVRREELVVERRPLAGVIDHKPVAAGPDEVSRVTLYREEIVIEKRLVPIEEVIMRKRVVTDYQTVDAILRSEHFETTQLSDGHDVRDTNHDGHVSMGEKIKSAIHGSNTSYDPRDTNHDGRLSLTERLKGSPEVHDPRDTNMDGRVSVGEKLNSAAHFKAARG